MNFITVGYTQINSNILNDEDMLHSFGFLPGKSDIIFQLEIISDAGIVQKMHYNISSPEQLIRLLCDLINEDICNDETVFGSWCMSDFHDAYTEGNEQRLRQQGKKLWNMLKNMLSNPVSSDEF